LEAEVPEVSRLLADNLISLAILTFSLST
jgi:hypothetical protein